ncbi:hypothetical protein SAMIE_1026380 [Sphingobium amiense]|uniref:SnoaL-like domain-containing protein n=1 Tax=Sphingobium amiense TaxID=135719 RepID=A0A494W972_9SPHN|nr:hypothetical protein [Sphingobium amiense]BBD99137.1 hypothetical protein SAMIE_1026380 [Sphingobium amiense]
MSGGRHDPQEAQAVTHPVALLLSHFGDAFNGQRVDEMARCYTDGFAAVVNGAFVDRAPYLESSVQLLAAGYRDIRFALRQCRDLGADMFLADGTTFVIDPEGVERWSIFSILCVDEGQGLQFSYTHSSMPVPVS